MVCLDYVVAALHSPRSVGEKTTTLVVHGRETWTVMRYDRYVVVEKNGRCRVYDEDDVVDVLRTELRDIVRVEKFKYMSDGPSVANVGELRAHLEHFDADVESRRDARFVFTTKRGLIHNSLVVAYDGHKFVATHKSDIAVVPVTRYDALETVTTFEDLQSALGFVEDHLSFRDDAATMDLGRVTKIVEIKILTV